MGIGCPSRLSSSIISSWKPCLQRLGFILFSRSRGHDYTTRLWKEEKPLPTALLWLSHVLFALIYLPQPPYTNPKLWEWYELRDLPVTGSPAKSLLSLKGWLSCLLYMPPSFSPSPLFPTGLNLRRVAFQWQVRFKCCDNWRFSSFWSCLCSDCNFITCQGPPESNKSLLFTICT